MNEICSELLDEIFQQAKKESETGGRAAHVAEILQSYVIFRPAHARAWALYGDALRELGRNQEGLNALTKAFDMSPEEYKGYIATNIAMLLKDFQSPSEAKKWFEIGTTLIGTNQGWPWILRGANLFLLGEFDAAVTCFEAVLRGQHDEKDEAFLNLGFVYRALGKYNEATACFEKALELTPNYDEALNALTSVAGITKTLDLVVKLIDTHRKLTTSVH